MLKNKKNWMIVHPKQPNLIKKVYKPKKEILNKALTNNVKIPPNYIIKRYFHFGKSKSVAVVKTFRSTKANRKKKPRSKTPVGRQKVESVWKLL